MTVDGEQRLKPRRRGQQGPVLLARVSRLPIPRHRPLLPDRENGPGHRGDPAGQGGLRQLSGTAALPDVRPGHSPGLRHMGRLRRGRTPAPAQAAAERITGRHLTQRHRRGMFRRADGRLTRARPGSRLRYAGTAGHTERKPRVYRNRNPGSHCHHRADRVVPAPLIEPTAHTFVVRRRGGAPSRWLARPTAAPDDQIGWTKSAWGPLVPWLAVNSTRWLSWRLR